MTYYLAVALTAIEETGGGMARDAHDDADDDSAVPPSIEIVCQLTRFEREKQEQRWDAVDNKAGVILGFAGVVAALVVTIGSAWFLIAAVPVTVSAIQALLVLKAGEYQSQNPEAAYKEWAPLPTARAYWQAYSDEVRTLRLNDEPYARKVAKLRGAWASLLVGVILVPLIALGRLIGPLIEEYCSYGG